MDFRYKIKFILMLLSCYIFSLGEEVIFRRETEEERKQIEKDTETTWYHEGPDSLRVARLWIANYSLPRAKLRLEEAKRAAELSTPSKTAKLQEIQKRLQNLSIYCSQIGDTRPISYCQFSPNSQLLATGSWFVVTYIKVLRFIIICLF